MVKIGTGDPKMPQEKKRVPYNRPNSLTYWAGLGLLAAGALIELQPTKWAGIVDFIESVTTLGGGELILLGLGLIGGRRKLEEIDLHRKD